nr:SpoIID/LytB domain-containing protein [Candidatus Dependentiae bacterium]
HQVYKGNLRSLSFKKYVEDTKGIVLVHDKKLVLAMFDICCGGIIPANKKGIDFAKAPYLKRSYACTFCKKYKFYAWQYTYSFDRIEAELRKVLPAFGVLRDIKVSSYDPVGVALEIKCRSGNTWFTLTASKFKSLFKELRSLYFSFKKSGRNLIIDGRGFGHLLGMCQRGALGMVEQGHDCKSILKFYYPGATFMRLKKNEVL